MIILDMDEEKMRDSMSSDEMTDVLIDQNRNNITDNCRMRNNSSGSHCMTECDRVQRPVKHAVRGENRGHKVKPSGVIDLPQNPESADDSAFTKLKSQNDNTKDKEKPNNMLETQDDVDDNDNEEDDVECNQESEDKQDEISLETIQRRVCLVKLYAWIKEEMSKSTARSLANHLYQCEPKLLSRYEHESIVQCSWRRDAVEQLLKKILMGRCGIYEKFIEALLIQEEKHIAEKLTTEHATDTDIEVFTTLEKSSLQQCTRPDSHEPRLHFTESDQQTLLYYLNNRNTIDNINDHFLSQFVFSIREHTNIVHCSLDCECRVKLLIDTLMLCAEKIFKNFCSIMEQIEMSHVIGKLEKRSQDGKCKQRKKRKSSTSQGMEPEASSSSETPSAKRQCLSPSTEICLVSAMQRSTSTLRLKAMDQFGFDVENVNKGSIVIQLCPKEPGSWQKLKENCRSGKIKEFIPVVYNNDAIKDQLQEGEYRLKFTIYELPTKPDTHDDKKVMFHLETEEENPKESSNAQSKPDHHDSHIEEVLDLLCEELEITKDLLNVLKKEKLVEENIKEEIDKQGSRAKKIKFLLKKVAAHGDKGYTVLKEYIKEENEDLYKVMVTREGVKVIDSKMDTAAKVTKSRTSSGSHRGVFKKEVFFTGTVVLKVKKTVVGKKKGTSDGSSTLDITCPEILDPICYFSAKDKENQGQSGEVTMVLEEAWGLVGADKPLNREILVGKRKQSKETNVNKKRLHSADTEEEGEAPEEEKNISDTDLSKDTSEAKSEKGKKTGKEKTDKSSTEEIKEDNKKTSFVKYT